MAPRIIPYTDEQLWPTLNAVLPCWVLLALIPNHKLTQALVLLVSFYLCCLYAALFIPMAITPAGQEGIQKMFSLEGIIELFKNKELVFVAWVHFIVFDLWCGRWIALDAVQRRVPRILVAPCLFCTLMAGPIGLGLYLIIRTPFSAPRGARAKHE